MTKIKICGITNLEDALAAVNFGADMLGFNFFEKSSRYIEPENANVIAGQIDPNIERIGVFVNASHEDVMEISASVGLDAIQLHGDETPIYIQRLDGLTIIKAVRLPADSQIAAFSEYRVDSILVDAFSSSEYGGTGQTCDWQIAAEVASKFPKVFLSGGLGAHNVVEAIETVHPYAVDACSLLESKKGKKDLRKLEEFISAVKQL